MPPFALPLLAACAHTLPPTMIPTDVLPYDTEDGWHSDVLHYAGPGAPVLLVHGMGANHYNWDYRPGVSLAAYLQERGYDVWIPELRGDPGAYAPDKASRGYTFDDHADYDIPAVIDAVRTATGAPKLLWVGHSMGGMLLYTTLEREPDAIAAGVVLGSPAVLTAQTRLHHLVAKYGTVVGHRGVLPVAGPTRDLIALFGRHNALYNRLAVRSNLDWPVANGLAEHGLIDMSRPMAREAVLWLREGALTHDDGTPWIKGGADVPILAFGGSEDRIVPAADVEASCALYPDCHYVLLGKATGFAVDYGHVDPVLGKTASTEVYPVIEGFLDSFVDDTRPVPIVAPPPAEDDAGEPPLALPVDANGQVVEPTQPPPDR